MNALPAGSLEYSATTSSAAWSICPSSATQQLHVRLPRYRCTNKRCLQKIFRAGLACAPDNSKTTDQVTHWILQRLCLNRMMCPGYCGECLRPDWRFGMSGQRKYSMELRERATRMALEARADPERRRGAIKRIGGQLGVNPEALRTWVRAVEQGGRNERGEISDQEARIRALEAENRELRRANEILKAASAFFGAELDRLGR